MHTNVQFKLFQYFSCKSLYIYIVVYQDMRGHDIKY